MAQRRMFSPDIVCSEEFLDMPSSSRELYFQLGMRADDDGFIQAKSVMRNINASPDDLKVLVTKRFVLPFESGVIVIKHWLIHNMIRGDRYKPTRFVDEKRTLFLKEDNVYTDDKEKGVPLLATKWQPNGNQMAPQVRLGKDSIPFSSENGSTSSQVKEVKTDSEGNEVERKKKKDYSVQPGWATYQKLLSRLRDDAEFEILTGVRDLIQTQKTLKVLSEKDILELVEEDIVNGNVKKMGYSLARILNNSRINKYRADWGV